jgi:hypothetical protein
MNGPPFKKPFGIVSDKRGLKRGGAAALSNILVTCLFVLGPSLAKILFEIQESGWNITFQQ